MFILNNKRIPLDIAFEHDGIKYPANWLRLATVEERDAIGITEVAEQPRPNDHYYWVTDNGDGTYTTLPKDLEYLKTIAVQEIKSIAATMLSTTDWKVVRAMETSTAVDSATLEYRSAVRAASNANELLVMQCENVAQLATVTYNWPPSK